MIHDRSAPGENEFHEISSPRCVSENSRLMMAADLFMQNHVYILILMAPDMSNILTSPVRFVHPDLSERICTE